MKDKKMRWKDKLETSTIDKELRERLHWEDMETRWMLEALDCIFTESKDYPEKFHELWVKPLLAEGISLDTAFSLLVDGRFRPN
jgi:hypothetical protein